MREAFSLWPEQWDDFRLEVLRMDDLGEHVLAPTRQTGRGKGSGVEVTTDFTFVFRVRGAKIDEWRIFLTEEQALEAIEASR